MSKNLKMTECVFNERVSSQQKSTLLAIHFDELKQGIDIFISTAKLREKVSQSLGRELYPNHFIVSLKSLADKGYLNHKTNQEKKVCANAKAHEKLWQLTAKGRMYAEELHSSLLRPKRSYQKRTTKKS